MTWDEKPDPNGPCKPFGLPRGQHDFTIGYCGRCGAKRPCPVCEDTGIATTDASSQGGPDLGGQCTCPAGRARSNEPTAAEVADRLQTAIDTHTSLNIMTIRESVKILLEERKELLAVVHDAKERPWNLFNRREWLKRAMKVKALQ